MELDDKQQKLSVVITSVNGFPILGECLDSISQQSGIGELEVIVANRCVNGVGTTIQDKYPWVKLIQAPFETSIPQLRARALRECTGDVVAMLEDHCLVKPDWAGKMLKAHNGQYPVIGGSVDNGACEKIVDWAAFFCEYSHLMKSLEEGEAESIPGNNVGYKRWVLERFWPDIEKGIWDSTLHEQIRKAGIPLFKVPSLTVNHKMSANLWWFITQKYHFARSFSSMRFVDTFWFRRALYGVGTVFLPFILAQRIVLGVWRTGMYRHELLLSFPILVLLLFSWGVGEAAGYLFGPGSSHAKVA